MGLIKSTAIPIALSSFSMRDIEQQAHSILSDARRKAEQLLMEAQLEGENIKKESHAQGVAEGRAEGLAAGQKQGHDAGHQEALLEYKDQFTAAISAINDATQQIEEQRQSLNSQAGGDVVKLAIAIARKASKRLGEIDEMVVHANVSEALKLVVSTSDVRIAVHTSQRRTLDESLPALKLKWQNLEHVEVVVDDAIAPGGCRIFTRGGSIDADLQSQIDRIVTDLLPPDGNQKHTTELAL
jgi:flagellar assembly protein FliH